MSRRLRVCFYAQTALLDSALHYVRELSELVELHLLVEMSPGSWRQGPVDLAPRDLVGDIIEADEVLGSEFPPALRSAWSGAASFRLVNHKHRRSISFGAMRTSRRAVRYMKALGPDLIHIDDVDVTPRLPLALPLLRGRPVVLSAHDPEPHLGEGSWRKKLSRRMAYPRADGIILHSAYAQESFSNASGIPLDRVRVVAFGPYEPTSSGTSSLAQEERTVLFFGRLSPYKGLETLYQAMPEIAGRVPGVHLIVAGSAAGAYRPPPPPELPGSATIEVKDGYIDNLERDRLFERASLVVCPYVEATQSGVIQTAKGFRRAVVASRVGGIPEYVQDGKTGLLVPPEQPAALADAVVRLLTQPALRRSMQHAIDGEVSGGGTWRQAALETVDFYESVLGRRGGDAGGDQ